MAETLMLLFGFWYEIVTEDKDGIPALLLVFYIFIGRCGIFWEINHLPTGKREIFFLIQN